MFAGLTLLQIKIRQLKSVMLLALATLFIVAVTRKQLQLTDLVCLLFAMFAACGRTDSSAYQVLSAAIRS